MVIGGPHATALPEEASRHADAVVVGEAEDTWPSVLDDACRGKLKPVYVSTRQAKLTGMPAPRWDLIRAAVTGNPSRLQRAGALIDVITAPFHSSTVLGRFGIVPLMRLCVKSPQVRHAR